MIADVGSHEELLIAIVGGMALVLVAVVPTLLNSRKNRSALDDMKTHLPPNGLRLYEMVLSTHQAAEAMQVQMAKMEMMLEQNRRLAEGSKARLDVIEGKVDDLPQVPTEGG